MKTRQSPGWSLVATFVLAVAGGTNYTSAQSASQLLKEGEFYHRLDDTTDRAAERYRLILSKYPNSIEAEQAQYYLGAYFQRKFDILESRNKIQDWTSFNQAEEALNSYSKKYSNTGKRWYLSDAYFSLAIIALRRGNDNAARNFLRTLIDVSRKDRTVNVYKLVWSPKSNNVVDAECDSMKLASATLEIIQNVSSFSERVSKLTDWSRSKCIKPLPTIIHPKNIRR